MEHIKSNRTPCTHLFKNISTQRDQFQQILIIIGNIMQQMLLMQLMLNAQEINFPCKL